MKRQRITHASLTNSATDAHLKGFQQYYTPRSWSTALGAALPYHRHTLADLHAGKGDLLHGLANDSTREVLGLDLDPTTSIGGKQAWTKTIGTDPLRHHAHGDILDLFPLLTDTATAFDLLALNPPFSLHWPLTLLPKRLRKGLNGKSIDSTHATLRMIPHLLTARGEGMLIANQRTLENLEQQFPDDFANVWLWIDLPSFFPGVDPSLRVGVLYLTASAVSCERRSFVTPITPDQLATALASARRELFSAMCVAQPWQADHTTSRRFIACADEMERRRDPSASSANVTLDHKGRIRTWITAYQEASVAIPAHAAAFLRSLNRRHPIELTLQHGTRLALQEILEAGIWNIAPDAREAIAQAMADYSRDRAPLSPIDDIQRIGWIDDAETLLCILDFGPFVAGVRYPLSTETIEWKKEENRPRYHKGKKDIETVRVRGTDLRLTLHHPDKGPHHFLYNPDHTDTETPPASLNDLAAHFELPAVPDITVLRAEDYQRNLALLDELEASIAAA